jgi:hypothetical protein
MVARSQYTAPYNGWKNERPSIMTSIEFERIPVAPRALTLTSRAPSWTTLNPGTPRSRSAKLSAADAWM